MEPIDLSCYLKQCPPSREEVEEMIDAKVNAHERVGRQWGVVYLAMHSAIVLWVFGAIYWLGQRLN